MRRIATALTLATALATAAVGGSGAALASSHGPHFSNLSYYLALGDSLSQGVQPNSQGADVQTNQGYPNQLNVALRQSNPYLRLVKLGCPGETTGSMISGGICTYSQGSQLAQAVKFLDNHAGQVQLVTIDIGANDLNPCLEGLTKITNKVIECLSTAIEGAVANLGEIMTALRGADPTGTIIGVTYYDPELAYWLQGTKAGRTVAEDSVILARGFDDALTSVYQAFSAPVANVYKAFRTADMKDTVTTPEFGTIPLDVAKLCSYTWQCAVPPVGPNEHANVLGYGVIAKTILDTYQSLAG